MLSRNIILGILALLPIANSQELPLQERLPQLKLDWGTWNATVYPKDRNIYKFENVRFGAEPVRFGASDFPKEKSDEVQNNPGPISCIQLNPKKLRNPPGGHSPMGDPGDRPEDGVEDCLFLDIYVPKAAFEPNAKPLPVIVWLFGGAFAFGSKTQTVDGPLYTGQSLLRASNYRAIFVAGNYRVGAFGWLAGSYMQEAGLPNAGLYDQALLFQWVQDHIGKVKGDKNRVSAWGESAGAGSILHHLIRNDGGIRPQFQSFMVQSPAFEWAWDNSKGGRLDQVFQNFSSHAGCGKKYDISCLREASVDTLRNANLRLFEDVKQTGMFPVGPSVDGKWIKTIPAVAFSQGKFSSKGINSALISHVGAEARTCTPKIENPADIAHFLETFLPGEQLAPQRKSITERYQCNCIKKPSDCQLCLARIIRDSSFTCNTRNLFDAFPTKSYMMQYNHPQKDVAFHASDLLPLFMNNWKEASKLGAGPVYGLTLQETVMSPYQNYFSSFAISGQPTSPGRYPEWKPAVSNDAGNLTDVMTVHALGGTFVLGMDEVNTRDICQFWTAIAQGLVNPKPIQGNELRVQAPDDVSDL